MFKKILTALLAVMMLAGILLPAFADETGVVIVDGPEVVSESEEPEKEAEEPEEKQNAADKENPEPKAEEPKGGSIIIGEKVEEEKKAEEPVEEPKTEETKEPVEQKSATEKKTEAVEEEHVHTVGTELERKSADCYYEGYIRYKCAECGKECLKVLPVSHSFDEFGRCTICGAVRPAEKEETCEHIYEVTGKKAPGCVNDGSITSVCALCGDAHTVRVRALGHNYKDGLCTICGDEEIKDTLMGAAPAEEPVEEPAPAEEPEEEPAPAEEPVEEPAPAEEPEEEPAPAEEPEEEPASAEEPEEELAPAEEPEEEPAPEEEPEEEPAPEEEPEEEPEPAEEPEVGLLNAAPAEEPGDKGLLAGSGETITTELILTAKSASKKYDGTPLTAEGLSGVKGLKTGDRIGEYTVSGSQLDAGSSENEIVDYKIFRGDEDVTELYVNVTLKTGTLTVTPRTITLKSASGSKKYDGTPLEKNGTGDITVTGDSLVSGDRIYVTIDGSQLHAGSSNNTFTYKFLDGEPGNYNIKPVYGTLTVKKRNITLNSLSAEKKYNGKPLTEETVAVGGDKFAPGEGADFDVTGSQTKVGKSKNTFTYWYWPNTLKTDYNVTLNYGTLRVYGGSTKTGVEDHWPVYFGSAAVLLAVIVVLAVSLKKKKNER